MAIRENLQALLDLEEAIAGILGPRELYDVKDLMADIEERGEFSEVRQLYNPEDIFTEEDLQNWAKNAGYVKPEED